MNRSSFLGLMLLTMAVLSAPSVLARIDIDMETGAYFSGYNDARIPGDGGTLFSLSEELAADPGMFYRIRVTYALNTRHHFSALFAPLTIDSSGRLDRDLVFADRTFPAGTRLATSFQFNSYRLSYRYDLLTKDTLELGIGFTAKIRDAIIAVEGNGIEAEKKNVGFVPIFHFRLLWKFSPTYAFLLEGDALAAPQGRAEDILAALIMQLSDRVDLKLGYRILEGGADNDEVYTFSLIHYASVGVIIHL